MKKRECLAPKQIYSAPAKLSKINRKSKKIAKEKEQQKPGARVCQVVRKRLLREFRDKTGRRDFIEIQEKRHYHVLSETFLDRVRQFYTEEAFESNGKMYGGFKVPVELFEKHLYVFLKLVATTLRAENGVLKFQRQN